MEYVILGAIGFAQLGTEDYWAKKEIEKKVVKEFLETECFKIPEKFVGMCHYAIRRFPYEYDAYYEAVLNYDDDLVKQWEDDWNEKYKRLGIANMECEKANVLLEAMENLADEFWDWVNSLKNIDFESQELMDKCYQLFKIEYPMKLVHRKPPNGDNEDLRAV